MKMPITNQKGRQRKVLKATFTCRGDRLLTQVFSQNSRLLYDKNWSLFVTKVFVSNSLTHLSRHDTIKCLLKGITIQYSLYYIDFSYSSQTDESSIT